MALELEQLRSVEWARQYKWEISFPDLPPPAPFDKFFPAADLDFGLSSINGSTIDTPMRPTEIPFGTDIHTVSISFYDDEKYTLTGWLKKWHKDVYNDGKYVTALKQASKTIIIEYLDSKNKIVKSYNYMIFPRGEVKKTGTSQSDTPVIQAEFVIVGENSK